MSLKRSAEPNSYVGESYMHHFLAGDIAGIYLPKVHMEQPVRWTGPGNGDDGSDDGGGSSGSSGSSGTQPLPSRPGPCDGCMPPHGPRGGDDTDGDPCGGTGGPDLTPDEAPEETNDAVDGEGDTGGE
jgi:hypothetical protein